jgi:glucose-6-phosphate 1-dehydrogenase
MMFPLPPGARIRRNYLAIGIQPDEGIHLRFEAKVPDTIADMTSVDMDFHYNEAFQDLVLPEAYERLLLDALQGDASLFTRSDGIEKSWELMDSILDVWESPKGPALSTYERGTWGPAEADYLMGRDSQKWIIGCGRHPGKG